MVDSDKKKNSKIPAKLLRLFYSQDKCETLLGDLDEGYRVFVSEKSLFRARFWYFVQLLKIITGILYNKIYWSFPMLKNYLKIALRNLKRQKMYSFINISGLGLGLACCILILLWMNDELSYDRFHKNAEDIYAVGCRMKIGDRVEYFFASPSAVGPAFKSEFPEIINSVRIYGETKDMVLKYGEKKYNEVISFADPEIFEVFSFPLVYGDKDNALANPQSIILTEDMALKYFGSKSPLGEMIQLDNSNFYTVTGVVKNIPKNSTIQFDFLIPLAFLTERYGADYLNMWRNYAYRTYFQVQKGISIDILNEKISNRFKKENTGDNEDIFLRPLSGLHLYWMGHGGGNIESVRVFGIAAILILFIACINFINLSLAGSVSRSKEIGLRKAFGAFKKDIIKQFYGESILLLCFSLILSIVLVKLTIPVFNGFTGKHLTFNILGDLKIMQILFGMTVFTAIVCGSYPALYLSTFQPVNAIRGIISIGKRNPV
ncbi:ABC transporter permease, partial [candidate division KSB1 bacterium]